MKQIAEVALRHTAIHIRWDEDAPSLAEIEFDCRHFDFSNYKGEQRVSECKVYVPVELALQLSRLHQPTQIRARVIIEIEEDEEDE